MKSQSVTKRGRCLWLLVVSAVLFVAASPLAFADPPSLNRSPGSSTAGDPPGTRLTPSRSEGSFDFETSLIQGTIRLDGPYHGVTRLVDKRTGKQVIDSRYSALNLFKLMSVNQAMDQPRHMERTIAVAANWVEVKWSATESHNAQITARYEVVQPNAVDVTVTVQSQGAYRGYELFMSSYFDKLLRPHVYLWSRGRRQHDLVLPTVSDVFRGTVLVFPRDTHAAQRCVDGRWERNERGTPTVQMCPVRHYAHCMGFMADPDKQLGVVLMSRPSNCYAISTRYHAENETDRLTDYSAFDLSLFGDDLLPTSERTVKIRLAVTQLDDELSQPLKLYQAFIAEMNNELDQLHHSDSKE
ncbi:MAG: hypothetical protein QF918_11130 [Pirellulaceae bacterium]|nr:hypothetical protein [Pirellulaceae bacterium]MDP6558109.1 hypothetical protein [Pirellulaceae bacterium]